MAPEEIVSMENPLYEVLIWKEPVGLVVAG